MTNSLTSHNGESRNSRSDKMSGLTKSCKKTLVGKSKTDIKKFYSAKRRMFLKNPNNYDKI